MNGIVLALISAVFFGLFQVFFRYSTRNLTSLSSTFFVLLVSTVILGSINLIQIGFINFYSIPIQGYFHFGMAGFIHFSIGWTTLNLSQKRLGASRTSTLVGTTPLFAAVTSLIALNESLDIAASLGILIIFIGVVTTMTDRAIQTAFNDVDLRSNTATYKDACFGLATALAWSLSAIFIRKGLEFVPSAIHGLSISMLLNSLLVGGLLLLTHQRITIFDRTKNKFIWQIFSGLMVTIAVLTQWSAYEKIEIAVVLALARLNIPIILVLAPCVIGHPIEKISIRVLLGGASIIGGSLILIFR